MGRTLLFHNPGAGTTDQAPAALIAALHGAGLSARYSSTRSPGFQAMLRLPADLVVVSGGDGTVAKVLTGRPDRRALHVILPHGTANNVARSLGISDEPAELAAAFATWRPRPFRLGIADGPWGRRRFVEAVGLGAVAELLQAAEGGAEPAGGVRGKLAWGRQQLARLLKTAAPVPMRFVLDGVAHEANVVMLEVLNTRASGPRLALAPETGEGMLHLTIVRAADRTAMRDWLQALDGSAREPSGPPPVWHLRGRNVVLHWTGMPLRLDDDWVPAPAAETVVRIGIDPHPIAVLAPPGRQRGLA